MNALHRVRGQQQQQAVSPAPADVPRPRAPSTISNPVHQQARPPPAPVDPAAYEGMIKQASLLGYSETNARQAAQVLQTEGRAPDINVLLDRLERM